MKTKINCFIPLGEVSQIEETIKGLKSTGLINNIPHSIKIVKYIKIIFSKLFRRHNCLRKGLQVY